MKGTIIKDLTVLILAGGDSDRFWPLSDKHSLTFLGKPLSFFSLAQFSKYGFRNIVIVGNDQNEPVFKKLKEGFPDFSIVFVSQKDFQGQAGAILSARKYITGKKLLVVNGADVYEDLLFSLMSKNLKDNPDGIISGIKQDTYFSGGYLKISKEQVVGLVEKPLPDKTPSNIVKLVFDYFKNADLLLESISETVSTADDIYEKAIENLLKDRLDFRFIQYKGFWGTLKYPWNALNIMSYYLHKLNRQKIKKANIHKTAIISGDVLIEDGVRILENTKIIGPTWIGANTIIGQNCLVRESMIGANCVVGYTTEIARSYIADNCWFHTNYIGDSVISSNVGMGAGTVIANFKLSEGTINSFVKDLKINTGKVKLGSMIGSNVRIGVNTSIMPGVKIGKGSFVGAGVVLEKDLPDNKFCFMGNNIHEIKDNKTRMFSESRKEIKNKLNSTLK